jgi:hypothetical protein
LYSWRLSLNIEGKILKLDILNTRSADSAFGNNGLVNGKSWVLQYGTNGWILGIRKMHQILERAEQWRMSQVSKTGELVQHKSWRKLCEIVFLEWNMKSK